MSCRLAIERKDVFVGMVVVVVEGKVVTSVSSNEKTRRR